MNNPIIIKEIFKPVLIEDIIKKHRQLHINYYGNNITLYMLLLAAYKILLSRYSSVEDIIVGSPIANRNHHAIEKLIGFFANTLVLRTNVSSQLTFLQMLARVNEICLEAYEHQDLPFERLVKELRPERNPSHAPIFQVMFAFQNSIGKSLQLEGLKLSNTNVDIFKFLISF